MKRSKGSFDDFRAKHTPCATLRLISLWVLCYVRATRLFSVAAFFILSWAPYTVFSVLQMTIRHLTLNTNFLCLPGIFAKSSALWNPIIYFLRDTEFRKMCRKRIGCMDYFFAKRRESSTTLQRREATAKSLDFFTGRESSVWIWVRVCVCVGGGCRMKWLQGVCTHGCDLFSLYKNSFLFILFTWILIFNSLFPRVLMSHQDLADSSLSLLYSCRTWSRDLFWTCTLYHWTVVRLNCCTI